MAGDAEDPEVGDVVGAALAERNQVIALPATSLPLESQVTGLAAASGKVEPEAAVGLVVAASVVGAVVGAVGLSLRVVGWAVVAGAGDSAGDAGAGAATFAELVVGAAGRSVSASSADCAGLRSHLRHLGQRLLEVEVRGK